MVITPVPVPDPPLGSPNHDAFDATVHEQLA
jgi:hypothetical protein